MSSSFFGEAEREQPRNHLDVTSVEENLTLRPLQVEDVANLLSLFVSQPVEYARFFSPFLFERATLSEILSKRVRDVYMGVFWLDQLVGFFMLRGWDEGYEVPTFGILIDSDFRGFGLEMLSLEAAKIISELRGASRLMIKMHPSNISAKGVARKIGFTLTGAEPESGNLIYNLEIKQRRPEPASGPDTQSTARI